MFAEFSSIFLLSLFFSREATDTTTKLILLAGFTLLAVSFTFVMLHWRARLGRMDGASIF